MFHDKSLGAGFEENSAERIAKFIPLVRRLAWQIYGRGTHGLELDDLMQCGLLALVECAQRHSGSGEDGFAAYAKLRVRGAMVDMVRRSVPGSRGSRERRRRVREAEDQLRLHLRRTPAPHELPEALGVSAAELETMRQSAEVVRFESLESFAENDSLFTDESADAFTILAEQELRDCFAIAISALPERLQIVVRLYFLEELNLSEISEIMGVSIPRVHQLKARAIDRLRVALVGIEQII